MRSAFVEALCEIAAEDERVWLLCGDLGFSVLEVFRDRYSARFVNVGVAEQNMTGVAAGLAHSGKIVFTYSIANFPTLRCLEQIRNDVCYHDLPVKVVSVGGGFAYGTLGHTHFGLQDLAIMRTLPGMTVIAPGDPVEARLATRAIAAHPGPGYLRLGKAHEPLVHRQSPRFDIGRAIRLRDGNDVTLICTGAMLSTVMEAAETLGARGVAARVLSMHTLVPLDEEAILVAARETGRIVSVEEHGPGGLGSAVAEVLAVHGGAGKFRPLCVERDHGPEIGSQGYLRARSGLTAEAISTAALSLM